ncbi:hypothetical protein [Pseudobutyrivibrio sp.]
MKVAIIDDLTTELDMLAGYLICFAKEEAKEFDGAVALDDLII